MSMVALTGGIVIIPVTYTYYTFKVALIPYTYIHLGSNFKNYLFL